TRFSRDWSSDVCSSDLTAQFGEHPFPDPVRLLQVRVSGQDELVDAERVVLLDPVGHLGVTADEGGARTTPYETDACPQVRGDLLVLARAAVLVEHSLLHGGLAVGP